MGKYVFLDDLGGSLESMPADSIVSRTIQRSEGIKVIIFGFAAGQELSQHTASVPAMLHFLEGEADLMLGEGNMRAKPGTWVFMEANLPHAIHARTPVKMLLTMVEKPE